MKINITSIYEVSYIKDEPFVSTEDRQVVPMDIYPEFNHHFEFNPQPGTTVKMLFVEISSDEGVKGHYGPIDPQQAFIIESLIAPFLKGKDPFAIEALHDQMLRLHRHGRTGLFMTGLSAVDLALWDLKGKALNLPVYRLLGGPTRPTVPAYASMLGSSIEPNRAAAAAQEMKAQGYSAQKWFFRYGPGSGQQGLEKNMAMAFAVREAVGEHYPLAFDAFNGWTEPYAVEMLQNLAAIHPLWVEEVVPPERIESLSRIRSACKVPIATGEHVYTRWQINELLVHGALDYVQSDPDWTGGITEQVKICALASSFNIPVIAHGHSILPALHIAAAQSPAVVPMIEFLVRLKSGKQTIYQEPLLPQNGEFPLPQSSGLGLDIADSILQSRREISWKNV